MVKKCFPNDQSEITRDGLQCRHRRDAGRFGAQDARSEAQAMELRVPQQRDVVVRKTALGTDAEHDAVFHFLELAQIRIAFGQQRQTQRGIVAKIAEPAVEAQRRGDLKTAAEIQYGRIPELQNKLSQTEKKSHEAGGDKILGRAGETVGAKLVADQAPRRMHLLRHAATPCASERATRSR